MKSQVESLNQKKELNCTHAGPKTVSGVGTVKERLSVAAKAKNQPTTMKKTVLSNPNNLTQTRATAISRATRTIARVTATARVTTTAISTKARTPAKPGTDPAPKISSAKTVSSPARNSRKSGLIQNPHYPTAANQPADCFTLNRIRSECASDTIKFHEW